MIIYAIIVTVLAIGFAIGYFINRTAYKAMLLLYAKKFEKPTADEIADAVNQTLGSGKGDKNVLPK